MILLTPLHRSALRANAAESERTPGHDPAPVVKLFNPVGPATWLASELDRDGDTLFGLADLGFGCPELGCFSLSEIARLRLPFGLCIERDLFFETAVSLSLWADTARRAGSIPAAEIVLRAAKRARRSDRLPPPDPGGG
jgi:hypothetical protein